MILWLLACGGSASLDQADDGPFHEEPPSISDIAFDCDPEEAEWVFEVSTVNWTGGGWVWMGKSESNVEGHRIKSVKAAADGRSDALKLTLDIEPDWRDAARGSSTRFLCSDRPAMSFMVTAYEPRGQSVADCRAWGRTPELWLTVDGAYDCERVWEIDPDTGR